jgi:signal transduction histidine kinase
MGDLIEAFNRMVTSIEEQRAGLNDTLSLFESMLANAPIGMAFFDRRCRFVRVNKFFADLNRVPLSGHLGCTLTGILPQPAADELESTIRSVFAQDKPVHNLELNGEEANLKQPWSWLVSVYPVRTSPREVRWAGVIVLDTSEHKRSEDALRKAEKLAVTGRLAASIAHEINNPLETVTNLLFLLGNFCNLEEAALNYVRMAEREIERIGEITGQTLGLYRQSQLLPGCTIEELLGSVLNSYKRRISALKLHVEQQFDPATNVLCFAGEVRQIFTNLVGNAIDASSEGGRLMVRARRSRNWKNPEQAGIRFSVADTGTGMEPAVRKRVFEAFFTTKEETGTGLGLWVSQEIVTKHDGVMHLRSCTAKAGKPSGTVFHIFIPDDPKSAETAKQTV